MLKIICEIMQATVCALLCSSSCSNAMEERFAGVELSSVEDQDQGELTGLTRNLDSLQVLGALAVVMS